MLILLSCLKKSARVCFICLSLILTGSASARDWIDRAWKDDVIYFVMTDRFLDGDPSNNIPPDSDPALYDAAQQNINLYHGGDFRGLEKALADGYFTDLGISAIWITPPVRNAWMSQHDLGGSKSGYHGYWTQDFRDIDPHLTSRTDRTGKPYPAGTAGRLQHYKDLIDLAHSKEIKVVQDIVCNHIGPLFYYDLDGTGAHENSIKEWQPPYLADETYRDTVRWANEPQWNLEKPDGFFQSLELYWAKGFSTDSLGKSDGEEQRCDFFSLRAINTSPEATHFDRLVDEFVDIYHFYIDELGVDGLRIDTVKHVHKGFWDAFTFRLRERLGPDADKLLMFGEVYGNTIEDINYYAGSSIDQSRSLDSLLNFQFTWAVRDVLRQDNQGDVNQLAHFIERMNNEVKNAGNYDAKAMRLNSINFIGNHDGLNRFLVEGISEENHALALATLLTLEGIPCIYYGSELAIRDHQVDRHQESETGRATLFDNQGKRTLEQRKSNPHFKQISELIALRKQLPVLVDGDINVYPVNQDGILAYRRGNALVVLNAGEQAKNFYVPATTLLYSNGLVGNSKPDRQCTVPAKTLQVYRMEEEKNMQSTAKGKAVIYQVFTRLFGNRNTNNKPWGTIEENGIGKFNDFTDAALEGIKEFGTTHIWYTGVPHHAVVRDYTAVGISNDDPDVVKGRAGSPYAVKDYYNVNPDLAEDPSKRLQEFKALVDRTHAHDMKVMIDIVPNHVARAYQSISSADDAKDFGADDNTSVEYDRDNNFYYIVGEPFRVPEGEVPLNGEAHPLADGQFEESPAKWTGNGSRLAQPNPNDWYETVKINYGVRPDGTHDFPALPEPLRGATFQEHARFWNDKEVPDSWIKFRDIALYWLDFGADGFRFDMAEMVPVEFWSYMNSSIKIHNAEAFCLAEVYTRDLYRNFIQLGLMDALYDKVDFYDTTKRIMQGQAPASDLLPIIGNLSDIDPHMLHFLENHDEQRIACPDFAGDAEMGKPAMTVSALAGRGPTLLYFAQALGEPADRDAGYGKATRTTIFDYWGLEKLKRWANDGAYDGGQLTDAEQSLRKHYTTLLSFSADNPAFNGSYLDLHRHNLANTATYGEKLFSFARWSGDSNVVVLASFDRTDSTEVELQLPEDLIKEWQLQNGTYQLRNIFSDSPEELRVKNGRGFIRTELAPMESQVFVLQ